MCQKYTMIVDYKTNAISNKEFIRYKFRKNLISKIIINKTYMVYNYIKKIFIYLFYIYA